MREALGWSRGRGSDYGDLHDSDPLMRPRLHADSDDYDALARLRPVKLPHLGSHADEHGRHSDELWRAVLSDPDWPYDAVPPPPMTSPPFDGGLVDGGGEWGGEQSSWGPTLDEYADGVNGIWVREVWNEIDRWLPGAGRLRGWSDRIRRTFGGAAGEPPPAELVVRPTEREEEAVSSGGRLGAGYFAPPATATATEFRPRPGGASCGGCARRRACGATRAVDGGRAMRRGGGGARGGCCAMVSPSPSRRSPSSPSAATGRCAGAAARPHRDARRRRRDAAVAGRRRRRPARRRRRARQHDGVARPRRQRLRRRRPRVRGRRAGAPPRAGGGGVRDIVGRKYVFRVVQQPLLRSHLVLHTIGRKFRRLTEPR